MKKMICLGICMLLISCIPYHAVCATENNVESEESHIEQTGESKQESEEGSEESSEESVAEREASEGSVSDNDAVSGNDVSGGEAFPAIRDDLPEDVIAFQVPANLDFMMDPFELCEKGQIYSEKYSFINRGKQAIKVRFTDIKCILAEDVQIAGNEIELEDILNSSEKRIQLHMLLGTGEIISLSDEPTEYEFVLEAGQQFDFQVAGNMSRNPSPFWKSGDAKISIVYAAEIIREDVDEKVHTE